MARGSSGRIVIEIDPSLKTDLYIALARESLTLRAWFVERAKTYLLARYQPSLFAAEPAPPPYHSDSDDEKRR